MEVKSILLYHESQIALSYMISYLWLWLLPWLEHFDNPPPPTSIPVLGWRESVISDCLAYWLEKMFHTETFAGLM